MILLDGQAVAKSLNENLKIAIKTYTLSRRKPRLAIILVGSHPASLSYIKGKLKAAESVGIEAHLYQLPQHATNEEVLEQIHTLNADKETDGIILQLPLPKELDERRLINAIEFQKDADGFHTLNQGRLYQSQPCVKPATPVGIIKLLEAYNIEVEGKHAVIVGRSNIVGFPVARMLMDRGATITVCHSKTSNLASHTKQADILVVATGKPQMITKEMVKEGVIVIDVGINRVQGKLVGDVAFEDLKDKVFAMTPVPKGVGPMTIHGLLNNTFELYKNRVKIN